MMDQVWRLRRMAGEGLLVVTAIASVVVYGLGDLTSGLLYHGYSYRDQWSRRCRHRPSRISADALLLCRHASLEDRVLSHVSFRVDIRSGAYVRLDCAAGTRCSVWRRLVEISSRAFRRSVVANCERHLSQTANPRHSSPIPATDALKGSGAGATVMGRHMGSVIASRPNRHGYPLRRKNVCPLVIVVGGIQIAGEMND
jgi:hypothetical protein